jgi:hypothetical protein
MRYFFYGTLLDADVRDRIVGPCAVTPARLDGWQRVAMQGKSYPVIVRRFGATVDGLLADGLDRAAARRLETYETDEYETERVTVTAADGRRVPALAFVAGARARPGTAPWCLEDWRTRHKRAFLRSSWVRASG